MLARGLQIKGFFWQKRQKANYTTKTIDAVIYIYYIYTYFVIYIYMLYMFIYTTIGRMPTSITSWEILTKFTHRMTESTEKKNKKNKSIYMYTVFE